MEVTTRPLQPAYSVCAHAQGDCDRLHCARAKALNIIILTALKRLQTTTERRQRGVVLIGTDRSTHTHTHTHTHVLHGDAEIVRRCEDEGGAERLQDTLRYKHLPPTSLRIL